ncbi:hypothetical protein COJ01_11985 [Priestia megaterium]|uniref:hypothetical protein n=1 Tax=Priestia megaterium TaxID=1404 RepID=UPI000BF522FD|nr:hypothetical protein [Priestia megaterium]PFL01174.1 hypothetical protein COJ01_11985 [Priestia megaterium]
MTNNWKELYARKNEHFTFVEEEVKEKLRKVVNELNNNLRKVHVRDAEVKDSYVDFPDCTIMFEVDKKEIVFKKEPRGQHSVIQATLTIGSGNEIIFGQINKAYFSFDSEVIDDVLKFLLMQ